jgi:hypothetical protein
MTDAAEHFGSAFLVGYENRWTQKLHRAQKRFDLFRAAGCEETLRRFLQAFDAGRHDAFMHGIINDTAIGVVEVEQNVTDCAIGEQ